MTPDNIYLYLELELDPPVTERTALTAELNRKIGEWNKLVVSSPKYKVRVNAARQFIKDGLPDIEQQAAAARTQKIEELRHAIAQQQLTGKIDEYGFTKLKQLFPCFSEVTIRTESGFSPERNFRIPKMPPSLDCNRLIPAIEMEAIAQDLAVVDGGLYTNLYELLGLPAGTIEYPQGTERNKLYKKALELNEVNRRITAKTPEVDAKNRLYGKSMNFFKDDNNQLDYEAALQRQKFEQLCKTTLQHRAIKGIITASIYEQSIIDAEQTGLKRQEAEYLVYEFYCIKLKCPTPITLDINTVPVAHTGQTFWDMFASRPQSARHAAPAPPIDTLKSLTIDEEPTLLLESFQCKDVKQAIKPFNEENLPVLFKDKTFWTVLLLCVLPLAITSGNKDKWFQFWNQLGTLTFEILCILAAGLVLRKLIVRSSESIRLPVIGFFFTATIGVSALLVGYNILPESIRNIDSNKWFLLLMQQIFICGLGEEIIKILPVVFYFIYYRSKSSIKQMMLIGFLSSLGLVASQTMLLPLLKELLGFNNGMMNWLRPATVLFCGKTNIASEVLPGISLFAANAVWTAIMVYFLSCTMRTRKDWHLFLSAGIGIPALLHGFYTWLVLTKYTGLASMLAGAGFILFYGYFSQIRLQIHKLHPTLVKK